MQQMNSYQKREIAPLTYNYSIANYIQTLFVDIGYIGNSSD